MFGVFDQVHVNILAGRLMIERTVRIRLDKSLFFCGILHLRQIFIVVHIGLSYGVPHLKEHHGKISYRVTG